MRRSPINASRLLAIAIGVAGGWLLAELFTPCEPHTAWCLAIFGAPVDWWRRNRRRGELAVLRVRQLQLELVSEALTRQLGAGFHPATALHLASAMCLRSAVDLRIKALQAEQTSARRPQ